MTSHAGSGLTEHAIPEPLPGWWRHGVPVAVLILSLLATLWSYNAAQDHVQTRAERRFVLETDQIAKLLCYKLGQQNEATEATGKLSEIEPAEHQSFDLKVYRGNEPTPAALFYP